MTDTTRAIIERIKQSGMAWTGKRLMEAGYIDTISVKVGGTFYTLDEDDATEADARKLAEIAGVDVSDIPPG